MKLLCMVCVVIIVCAPAARSGDSNREQAARVAYARWQETGTASPEEKALMEQVLFTQTESVRASGLDDNGARDDFGYQWVDNQAGDTTTFAWIELCGDSLAQFGPIGDDNVGLINWSFSFPFYGTTYTAAYVSVNGKIAFESADAAWLNTCAPIDASQPVISVHWDDLVAQQQGDCGNGTSRIKYRDFGDYLVIEWKHVWHYPDPAADHRYSFEAMLCANGKIKLQYDSLNCGGYCNSATVGIDVPGADGVEYVCNGVPETNQLGYGRAVWFYGPPSRPQDLVINAQSSNIFLSWQSVADADSYYVYRSASHDIEIAPVNLIAATADTSFTDVGIIDAAGTAHFYAVTAVRQ